MQHISDMIDRTLRQTSNDQHLGKERLTTCFPKIDECTGGICKHETTLIVGESWCGKTQFMLQLASHCAIDLDVPVLWITTLDCPMLLSMRLLSTVSRASMAMLSVCYISHEEAETIESSADLIRKSPFYFHDELRGRVGSVEAALWTFLEHAPSKEGWSGVVFIDDLQTMLLYGRLIERISNLARANDIAIFMSCEIPPTEGLGLVQKYLALRRLGISNASFDRTAYLGVHLDAYGGCPTTQSENIMSQDICLFVANNPTKPRHSPITMCMDRTPYIYDERPLGRVKTDV